MNFQHLERKCHRQGLTNPQKENVLKMCIKALFKFCWNLLNQIGNYYESDFIVTYRIDSHQNFYL